MRETSQVAPFRGLRYSREKVRDLALVMAPPYDVISPEHQERLYERDPHNVIRLILGMELPNRPEDNRYSRAAAELERWTREGVLQQDKEPSLYLYEEGFSLEGKRYQRRGFIALCRLEEFGPRIKPHEKTMAGPKKDRLQLMQSCQTNLSPVFSLYADPDKEITRLLNPSYEGDPVIDLVDDEQVRHRVWKISDPTLLHSLSQQMEGRHLFLADGHHRYETSLAYRDLMRQKYPQANATAPFNFIMMFFAELGDPGLLILPTHRLVLGLKNMDPAAVIASLREQFQIESFRSEHRREFLQALESLAGKQRGFGLRFSRETKYHLVSSPSRQGLDVLLVHEVLLRKILKFSEEDEKDPNKIEYIKAAETLFQRMETTPESLGIWLNPAQPDQIAKVVEQGMVLPPKSTYFYPKLLSGLVFHSLKI